MQTLLRCVGVAIALSIGSACAKEMGVSARGVSEGIALRNMGQLDQSIEALTVAAANATSDAERHRASGELGISLLQARRLEQAGAPLQTAHRFFTGGERARYALELGRLATLNKRPNEARSHYEEALGLAGSDRVLALSARLNLVRLAPESQRLTLLTEIHPTIGTVQDPAARARLLLNLGEQAHALGPAALPLAYDSYARARDSAAAVAHTRLRVESLDALAQLYEDQNRAQDAWVLTRTAVDIARAHAAESSGDLLVNLEWRQARILRALGRDDAALAAYQRAVDQVERIRQDIPIEYDDGTSSYKRTLEPIYLGLFDALLRAADKHGGDVRASYLRRARDAVELIKQAELQDYLGDRCTVDTVKGGTATVIPEGTAVLYPIILADRIELLLETSSRIERVSTHVAGLIVRNTALLFANELREGRAGYLTRAKELYDWMLRPLERFIADQRIDTLVVVPDGALRLVPIGALHDGERFMVEKLAVTTVTGLSMTNTTAPSKQGGQFLLAGVSEPGPVVQKLGQTTIEQLLGPAAAKKVDVAMLSEGRTLRSVRRPLPSGDREKALREALALPGVKEEVEAIARIVRSKTLLNEPFTVAGFRREAESGAYRIVHVASHGVFGGSAGASYVLAYDDLLTLDGLQSLLKADEFRKSPIELLSLSACETAEGDERSPLGISGAAMKARAKSVLGTLWPVDDTAARQAMERFYRELVTARTTKADALRKSQLALLRSGEFSHPFFWAPFALIGNWL